MVVRLLCRSRARLESETFTTVASTCPMRDPSTATAVIFQTSGSSGFLVLGKCVEDLIGRAHATESREYLLECETMLFTILAGAGVFNDDEAKAEAGTLSRRGLYSRIGRDSGEDDRIDTMRLKLLLKIGSGKGAPVTFRKQDVAGLKSGRRGNLRNNAGQRCIPQVKRLVDRKLEEIVEVDADINNRGSVAAKRFGQLYRIGNDLCGWMRRGTHADDGILEVNENKCCFVGIKPKFCHGTPLGKDFTEIEGILDFQGIEYEDVLGFVKFDKGRTATGALFTQARQFPGCGGGTVCRGWL